MRRCDGASPSARAVAPPLLDPLMLLDRIVRFFPRTASADSLRLQDELAYFVALRLLFGGDVLPAQHAPALRAADVAYRVRARDELPRHGLVSVSVRQIWKNIVLGLRGSQIDRV